MGVYFSIASQPIRSCYRGLRSRFAVLKKNLTHLIKRIHQFSASIFKKFSHSGASHETDPKGNKVVLKIAEAPEEINTLVKRILLGEELEAAQPLDKALVEKNLVKYFGEELVNSVSHLYGFDKKEKLSSNELIALIIGIKANMTLEALGHVYKERRELIPQFSRKAVNFEGLSPYELHELLKHIRYRITPPEAKNTNYEKQLKKDNHLLERFEAIDHYAPEHLTPSQDSAFQQFRYAEFLARTVIYKLMPPATSSFVDGTLFIVYDFRLGNEPILMEAYRNISTKGLHAINVIPARPVNHQNFGYMGATVFRGTQLGDLWSVHRDFDFLTMVKQRARHLGPGFKSFEEHQQKLIDHVHRDIEKLRKNAGIDSNTEFPVSWDFIGQSLGGTDAQRMALAFSKASPLKMRQLAVWTHNAPRVEKKAAEEFLESVRSNPEVHYRILHARTDEDIAQAAGEVLLGHFAKDSQPPKNLNATVVTFDVQEKERRVRHSAWQTAGIAKNGRANPAYVIDIATNDPAFEGTMYGKDRNSKAMLDDKTLCKRFNTRRKPNKSSTIPVENAADRDADHS